MDTAVEAIAALYATMGLDAVSFGHGMRTALMLARFHPEYALAALQEESGGDYGAVLPTVDLLVQRYPVRRTEGD